jgi:hypothetical protein
MIRIQAKESKKFKIITVSEPSLFPLRGHWIPAFQKSANLEGRPPRERPLNYHRELQVSGRLRGICNTIRYRTGFGFGWDCCDLKDYSTSVGRQNQPLSGEQMSFPGLQGLEQCQVSRVPYGPNRSYRRERILSNANGEIAVIVCHMQHD